MSEDLPESMPQDMPERMSDDLPDKMSEDSHGGDHWKCQKIVMMGITRNNLVFFSSVAMCGRLQHDARNIADHREKTYISGIAVFVPKFRRSPRKNTYFGHRCFCPVGSRFVTSQFLAPSPGQLVGITGNVRR